MSTTGYVHLTASFVVQNSTASECMRTQELAMDVDEDEGQDTDDDDDFVTAGLYPVSSSVVFTHFDRQ